MHRVLVADDEPLERQVVCDILRRSGLDVEVAWEATNGEEALEVCQAHSPGIVIMDLRMPGMSGLESIERIAEIGNVPKILILTAYEDFDAARSAVSLPVVDFLLKPVRPSVLVKAVGQVVALIEQEQEQVKQQERLRSRLVSALPSIEVHFLQSWLVFNELDEQEIVERVRLLGLKAVPSVVMYLTLDERACSPEADRDRLRQRTFRLISEKLHSEGTGLVTMFGRDGFLIATVAETGLRECVSFAEELRQALALTLDCPSTIGIGSVRTSPGLLHESFDEAVRANEYRFVAGSNRTIPFASMVASSERNSPSPLTGREELLRKLRSGDREGAKSAVREVLRTLGETPNSSVAHLLKVRTMEMVYLLSRVLLEKGLEVDQTLTVNLDDIYRAASVGTAELESQVDQLIDKIVDSIEESYSARQNLAVKTATEYIKANYMLDLSLDELSRFVSLSPSYLSRIFRTATGSTISEYTAKVRIREARVLLSSTQKAVAQIASLVGYRDANYFSQVFRKYVGMTPTVYRSIGSKEHCATDSLDDDRKVVLV